MSTESTLSGCACTAAPVTSWQDGLSQFKRPNRLKSSWQIVNSLLPFCGLWYLMYLSISWSYWLTLLLAIPTAGLLVRLFIIQHDCGHHSFFRSRRANDLLGTCCGVLTLTPVPLMASKSFPASCEQRRSHPSRSWRRVGIDRRRVSQVAPISAGCGIECIAIHCSCFYLGPSLLFILRQRFTYYIPRAWRRERRSVHMTNLGILAACGRGLVYNWAASVFSGSCSDRDPGVLQSAVGCFLSSINMNKPIGSRTSDGISFARRSKAVRITVCRVYCNGLLAISAFTTSIILKAEFRTTIWRLVMLPCRSFATGRDTWGFGTALSVPG